jgi:hypothetical protein
VLWYHTSFRCAKFRYAISLFFSWAIRSASTAENRFSNDSPREKLIRSTSLSLSLSLWLPGEKEAPDFSDVGRLLEGSSIRFDSMPPQALSDVVRTRLLLQTGGTAFRRHLSGQ